MEILKSHLVLFGQKSFIRLSELVCVLLKRILEKKIFWLSQESNIDL